MSSAGSSLRRGPWLSGLIMATIGAVWTMARVLGGVVTLAIDVLQVASVARYGNGSPISRVILVRQ